MTSRHGPKPGRWRGSKSRAPACGIASSRSPPRWGHSTRWGTRPTACRCTTRGGSRRRARPGAGPPPRNWWSDRVRPRPTSRSWRAGMTGGDADALAREPIAARGCGAAFGASLGHGLGLEVHEAPRLSKTNTDPLPAGAVVTIEPGVYLAGDGGVRIEDDVHLPAGERGAELLSDGLTDLLELV